MDYRTLSFPSLKQLSTLIVSVVLLGAWLKYAFATQGFFWFGNAVIGHCFSNLLKKGVENLSKRRRLLCSEDAARKEHEREIERKSCSIEEIGIPS